MNLLSLLMGTMTSGSSLNQLSGMTGASKKQTSMLIKLALPILLRALTKNASSGAGAASLLGALTQHTDKKSIADQMANADQEDGSKILGHILGGQSESLINGLSADTGMDSSQVSQILYSMMPALLSGLSAAADTAQQNQSADNLDLSGLYSTFGGEEQQQGMDMSSLFGSLFGGQSQGGLFGDVQQVQPQVQPQVQSQPQSSGLFGNLFGSLFGADQAAEPAAQAPAQNIQSLGTPKPQQISQPAYSDVQPIQSTSGMGSLFGGQSQSSQSGSLFGSLFGGNEVQQIQQQNTSSFDGSSLLSLLLSSMQ